MLRRIWIASLVPLLLLAAMGTSPLAAQHIFINRGNTGPDALALEHAVKKLAAHDTRMQTLDEALDGLADSAERFTRMAQRPASYYALQREFDNLVPHYVAARNIIETAADWNRGHPRYQEWIAVQTAFDRLYTNLYGYDLLDPYFGRHPDFAATPVPLRIPRETPPRPLSPRRPTWLHEDYESRRSEGRLPPYAVPYSGNAEPVPGQPEIIFRSRGNPRQF